MAIIVTGHRQGQTPIFEEDFDWTRYGNSNRAVPFMSAEQAALAQGDQSSPTPAAEQETPRKRFMRRAGLTALVDPFIDGVAEQEIGRVEDISEFASYYTSPMTGEGPDLMIEDLRRSQHSFVFANPGCGKTTLRLMLDVSCRLQPDGALVVESPFDVRVTHPLTAQEHARRIAAALAIDLVLQIIEQVPERPREDGWLQSPNRIAALARQMTAGGETLRQKVAEICKPGAEHPDTDLLREEMRRKGSLSPENRLLAIKLRSVGLGMYWPSLGLYPVQYIGLPGDLRAALLQALELASSFAPTVDSFDAVWQGAEDARAWGFDQCFILIDGIDSIFEDSATMFDLIAPLLEALPAAGEHSVFFKFFAPPEVRPLIDGWREKMLHSFDLYSISLNATINWTQPALRQLLIRRFRAAGLYALDHLDELVDPALRKKRGKRSFEGQLLTKAKQEPRKLIQLVNQLIELHAERELAQFNFSQADLDQLRI